MNVIFAHDHVFYKAERNYYSTGGLSKKTLEKYSSVFGKITVLSRQKNSEKLKSKMTLASAKGVEFEKIPDFKAIKNIFWVFEAKKKIENEIMVADGVIARLPSSIGNIAVKMAIKHNKPYLIEVVTCPWDALWNHSFRGKILAPFGYAKLKKITKKAPFVSYVTNSFLQNRYPTLGKQTNCSNVSLTEFDENILTLRKERIRNNNGKKIIGTAAAVNVKFKGQQYVIQALGELKKEGVTNLEYQLVGSGDQRYLKNLAIKYNVSDQVKFLGALPHEKVFNWLDKIDFYVQPSKQEGLPRALIEAMSRGVPAFGANTAGIPELLESEYIFTNSNNTLEIRSILKKYTKKKMLEQSERNYKEAKKYSEEVIERRRRAFLEDFKKSF
ncbi:glycosyltransferase [Tetragenococcus koreensis]|uniref:glycosyltransferase n=1 Tax=Tetragenococcus koreensis TaxID=290335 RepID=UPI001F16C3F1|nr:glycosyltransferase [Tetragenococcus koreensis]MDN6641273.1 glycosyltransferase [Tetragenococcus sp.]MCF1617093.1 glycosyltransferase [Tetragenococcus koreensis]MCF1621976.1 glycosyltransferase [Tetragenococcus koreensis]MCF1641819.1 glycosyltransferase [Tetragenococcus koreensis]MCF1678046.1 glycosyltransferase [Tetragenococcus koreensis]